MRTYIDMSFTGDGTGPLEIVSHLESLDIKPVRGIHDFYFDWKTDEEFQKKVTALHEALKGMNVRYRLHTVTEDEMIAEANFVMTYR